MLAHWNNSHQIDMSLNSDTLSWFRANQSLLFLFYAACSREATNTNFIVFGLAPTRFQTQDLPHSGGEHANHYATDAVCWLVNGIILIQLFSLRWVIIPNEQFFSLTWHEQDIFNEMMMMSALLEQLLNWCDHRNCYSLKKIWLHWKACSVFRSINQIMKVSQSKYYH